MSPLPGSQIGGELHKAGGGTLVSKASGTAPTNFPFGPVHHEGTLTAQQELSYITTRRWQGGGGRRQSPSPMPTDTNSERAQLVGHNLEHLRHHAGLSQMRLALQVDVTQQVIDRWERGKCEPRHASLERLAETLGCHWTTFYDPNLKDPAGGRPRPCDTDSRGTAAAQSSTTTGGWR